MSRVIVVYYFYLESWGVRTKLKMERFFIGLTLLPRSGWAIWYKNRVVAIPKEFIAQIRAAPTETPGWFEEELKQAWKHLFPITPESIRLGDLPLEHKAWDLTPNSW